MEALASYDETSEQVAALVPEDNSSTMMVGIDSMTNLLEETK